MSEILEIDDAHVHFGGVRAVDGVTLSVRAGELLGLIGPNGSGKSTLIAALSRLVNLTSGSIAIDGNDYTDAPPHEVSALGIGRTFQLVRLLPSMTVLENVMLGAATDYARRSPLGNWLLLGRLRRAEKQVRAGALGALERVGMADAAAAYPSELPYGSQRKVEIARALACEPKVLLLDEPTTSMIRAEKEEVSDLMLELRRAGLTQILVEHDLPMIHRVCSHAVALNFGKVIATGSSEEVAADPLVREAYLGHGDGETKPDLVGSGE